MKLYAQVFAIGFEYTEARLLAGMICDEVVLEHASTLELADLTNYRAVELLTVMRNLQARGEKLDVIAILDEIERRDFEMDWHVGDRVNGYYLADLILDTQPYNFHYRYEVLDGISHYNGEPIDWQKFIVQAAQVAELVKAGADDPIRIAAVDRLRARGLTAHCDRAVEVDELTDEQLDQCKADAVAADIRFLRYAKANPLPVSLPKGTDDHPAHDDDRRLRVQREPNRRRTRRSSRTGIPRP